MLRNSKQREAILKVLRSAPAHPGADGIYGAVRQKIPTISLATVYRNLALLKKSGHILELEFADGVTRFDGNTEEHYHFRCSQCGRVFDLEEPVDRTIEGKVAGRTGFKVRGHHLELFGICKECQQPASFPRDEYLPSQECMT